MICRVWWRMCARFFAARAERAVQDAARFRRRSEEFFQRLGGVE
jgi:hypothetical protein